MNLVQISPGLFSQLIEQNIMAWLKRLAFLVNCSARLSLKRSMCAWSSSDKLCCVLKGYLSLLCNRSLVSYVGTMHTSVGREGELVGAAGRCPPQSESRAPPRIRVRGSSSFD